jgi:hypothetical protein
VKPLAARALVAALLVPSLLARAPHAVAAPPDGELAAATESGSAATFDDGVAAAMPDDISLDDPDLYEARWTWLHNGPPGCWEIVGRATWEWDAGRFGASSGNAAFLGKLEDGIWRDLVIRSLGEDVKAWGRDPVHQYAHGKLRFVPMIGRLGPRITHDADAGEDALLEDLIDQLGGSVVASHIDWDEARNGVVLTRNVPIGLERAPVQAPMKIFFPEGKELPTRLDVRIQEPFSVPGGRGARIRSAEAHIRGRAFGGMVFPEAESIRFQASFLGFSFFGGQSVTYESVRPCGMSSEAEPEPVTPTSP